jgi:hypothetical protein
MLRQWYEERGASTYSERASPETPWPPPAERLVGPIIILRGCALPVLCGNLLLWAVVEQS